MPARRPAKAAGAPFQVGRARRSSGAHAVMARPPLRSAAMPLDQPAGAMLEAEHDARLTR